MVLQSFLQSLFEQPDATKLGLLVTIPVVAWWLLGVVTGPRSTLKGTRKIHRPPGLPFLGNTVELLSNSYRFQSWIYELCKKYNGEPVLLTAVGRPDLLVMASTQAFEDCLKTEFDNFPKGPFQCGNLQGILGDGIFAVDYGKWVHQRKTASNLFTARTLRDGMTATVRKHTVILRDIFERAAKTGEPIDLFKMFNRLTIEAFAEIGFGIEMKCLERKDDHPFQVAFDSAQRVIAERFLRPHLFWKLQRLLGVGIEGQLQKDVKVIDDTVLEIIKESLARRQSGETKQGGGSDVVSLFLDNFENSADSKDRSFDPTYLRDIVVNFLIAGRDTTAQALSWFFLSVSQHPHVAKKIREEIKRELPGLLDGTVSTPTMEQVSNLTYLEAALKETLRLYPSVPFTTKLAVNDIVLSDGTFVRKDSYIGLPSYALGRMTNVWGPDATEFKPERWIDENTGKIINVSAYKFVAFNAGPRLCLGMNLAMMEMKIVVATVLSRLDVKMVPGQDITYDFSLTIPVRGELLASVTKLK